MTWHTVAGTVRFTHTHQYTENSHQSMVLDAMLDADDQAFVQICAITGDGIMCLMRIQ